MSHWKRCQKKIIKGFFYLDKVDVILLGLPVDLLELGEQDLVLGGCLVEEHDRQVVVSLDQTVKHGNLTIVGMRREKWGGNYLQNFVDLESWNWHETITVTLLISSCFSSSSIHLITWLSFRRSPNSHQNHLYLYKGWLLNIAPSNISGTPFSK